MRRRFIALALLFAPLAAFPQDRAESVELWAFRYGTSRLAEKAVFADGRPSRTVAVAWLFYALRLDERWVLIDTGFDDPAMIKYFGVDWTDPIGLLKKAGIGPEDVSLVLLTHAHFDHIGLADRFPKARIIMSERARRDAVLHAAPPGLRAFFKDSGRIDTFRGRLAIGGGITMVEIGGHSPGSSVIRLEAEKVIFTGDEAYLPDNWTVPRANGTSSDAKANQTFLEKLKKEASQYLVLTHHDPALLPTGEQVKRLR